MVMNKLSLNKLCYRQTYIRQSVTCFYSKSKKRRLTEMNIKKTVNRYFQCNFPVHLNGFISLNIETQYIR